MKQALILGATSDIAQAVASVYAEQGYHLTLASRNIGRLQALKTDLNLKFNRDIDLVEFDANRTDSHQEFYQNLSQKPDVAIVCFGYLGDNETSLHDFQEADQIIHTNYTASVSISNIIALDFEQRKSGSIIAISSVAGDRGRKSNIIYGSAKAAYSTYISGIRQRLSKSNVHVMLVIPGYVDTKMVAHVKLPPIITASPQEVAIDIYRGMSKHKDVIYTLWMWRWIMTIIKLIPETIFKKLSI